MEISNSWIKGLDVMRRISNSMIPIIDWVLFFGSLVAFVEVVYDVGFDTSAQNERILKQFHYSFILFYIILGSIVCVLNFFHSEKAKKQKIFEWVLLLLYVLAFEFIGQKWNLSRTPFLYKSYSYFIFPLFTLTFFYSFSKNASKIYTKELNPAMLFVFSFFSLSCIGTLGLLLPKSSVDGVSYIDAFFVAVSAVCTTGLSTIDVSQEFTILGNTIVMLLMQLGGLGIMTFAGLFSKIFASSSSFNQQKILRASFQPQKTFGDMIVGDKLSEVTNAIYQIMLITFLIEGIGALGIYLSTWDYPFNGQADRVFFAVFHSVSAFCNTGFVLSADGLLHPMITNNYVFHMIIAVLYILGGLGFPLVFVFYSQIKRFITNVYRKFIHQRHFVYAAQAYDLNAKLVLYTTFILITISMFFVGLIEWSGSLEDRSFWGKIAGVFFTATAPSYAGINDIDMGLLAYPTALFFMLLMWIGASPESTGGGIKNTTIAVSMLNLWSIAKGKERVVVFNNEISKESIRRAYAVISISIVFMGIFTFLLFSFDGEQSLMQIVFEVFSAFNNNGLSLGITSDLSTESKFILCIAMFVGRVGTLSLLSAFLYKKRNNKYKYPSQEIIY